VGGRKREREAKRQLDIANAAVNTAFSKWIEELDKLDRLEQKSP
jgi:hypothetical protein